MDMIAMLAGLGGPVDPWSRKTAYNEYADNGTSTGSAAGYGTVGEYLRSKSLFDELPALPKPVAVTARSPYGPKMLSESDFYASVGVSSGIIPTPKDLIAAAEKKAKDWPKSTESEDQRTERKKTLLRALTMGVGVKNADMDAWEIQMANRAIFLMAFENPSWFLSELEKYIKDQQDKFGKPNNQKGVGAIVYKLGRDGKQALEVLRNLAANKEVSGPVFNPNEKLPTQTAPSGSSSQTTNLFGLGTINYNGGWPALSNLIKVDPDGQQRAIVAASLRVANANNDKDFSWSGSSTLPSYAIAEGLIIKTYGNAADQILAWRSARTRYIFAKRSYDQKLSEWQRRETYRNNRIKAIEDYFNAVSNKLKSDAEKTEYSSRRDALRRGAAAVEAEKTAARLKKEAEDALAAKATAEQTARDLQIALNDLRNAGSTIDIAALNATIEQLKQDLVNAQNAAAEAARRANETATTSGGDTTGAAGVATDAATDATQTASDALQQAGEEVVIKPKEKKGGGVMLLVVGAIAVGGYMWMKRRQLRQIGP